jgi:hypothetical protein
MLKARRKTLKDSENKVTHDPDVSLIFSLLEETYLELSARFGWNPVNCYHYSVKHGVCYGAPIPLGNKEVWGREGLFEELNKRLIERGYKPIREEAGRIRDEIEQELPLCTDPALRIKTEELLSLYYSVESVYMDMMTGYRVFHAPVVDELFEKPELHAMEKILRTLQEEYKRFTEEATSLLEELKKCRD